MTGLDKEFDELFKTLLSPARYAKNMMNGNSYPPYNIIRVSAEETVIEIAAAGFKKPELSVAVEDGMLKISGKKTDTDVADYVYKGIGGRAFERAFTLSTDMEVASADYTDGILAVTIRKYVKKEKKMLSIPIGGGSTRQYLTEKDDII